MESNFSHHATFERLQVIGLEPQISIPLLKTVSGWIRNHGPEWTVSRLKNLKSAYLNFISGKTFLSDTFNIRMHADGTPYGAFRPLFRFVNKRKRIQALNTLMMYSGITLKRVTQAQFKKFYESVVMPLPQLGEYEVTVTPEQRWSAISCWNSSTYTQLDAWTCSDKRAPFKKIGVSGLATAVESELLIVTHLNALQGPLGLDLLYYCPIPFKKSCGIAIREGEKRGRPNDGKFPDKLPYEFVGRIGFIQERGAKLRAVANPFRVYQAALSRLGNALFDFLKTSCAWDCTFDQDRGIKWAQQKLSSGKTIYSVDLSDATNQFPLTLQMQILRSLLGSNLLANPSTHQQELRQCLYLFEKISTSRWHIPHHREDLRDAGAPFSLTWSKGQPLGLYPSFAAFAVSHGLLLNHIERSLGLKDTFVILGDDVCISDNNVYIHYRDALKILGCPVSELKSLESSELSEFAGRVISSDGPLPVEKWKPWTKLDCVSVIRQYGVKGAQLIPEEYRKVILEFCSIPEPVGLGLNPQGKPLEKRLVGIEDLFLPKAEQINIPNYRKIEQFYDLAIAFQPYLVQNYLNSVLSIEESSSWSNRPDVKNVLWMEHYNAAIKYGSFVEVPDFLFQLRRYLDTFRSKRSAHKPGNSHTNTFLYYLQSVVHKLWLS